MFNLFRKRDKYQFSNALITQLINLINRVKKNVSEDSDMTYCYYKTPKALIAKLDENIIALKNGNMEVVDDLAVDFAPTSSLQEHSLCNNWSDDFLIIAEEFDSIQRLMKK